LLGAEGLEPPKLESTIAAETVITVTKRIQHSVFRSDRDCILTG
jgi:hypothetical protein